MAEFTWNTEAFDRLSTVDPAEANAIAAIVEEVAGFIPLTVRYAIAVLVIEQQERNLV